MNGFAERYLVEETSGTKTTPTSKTSELSGQVHMSTLRQEGAKFEGEGSAPRSPLMIFEQFLESLTSADKDCRIVIKWSGMWTEF